MAYVFAYPHLLCNSVDCMFLSKGKKNKRIKMARWPKNRLGHLIRFLMMAKKY